MTADNKQPHPPIPASRVLGLEESKELTRLAALRADDRRKVSYAKQMELGHDPVTGEPNVVQVEGVAMNAVVPDADILHREPNRADKRRHQRQLREVQHIRKKQELRKSKSRKKG